MTRNPHLLRLDLQAPPAVHTRWRIAAAFEGQPLAAWARAALNRAADDSAEDRDPDAAPVDIDVRRTWLRRDGEIEVSNLVYRLAQAIYEWGGEHNHDEDGKPILVGNGHHMAQELCTAAADIWKRHRCGVEGK